MFSSFGLAPRGTARNGNSGSRFLPNAPRGFSVTHVFQNPSPHSQPTPAPMAPVTGPVKYDAPPQSRGSNGSHWNRQPSYRAPHHESSELKTLLAASAPVPLSQDRRLVQVPAPWPVDTKLSKSQKSYGIYPSLTSDIYIYERSITSASFEDDDLASSPSSDSSSSDLDHFAHTATFASVEVSSTRASSSTETLESTLTVQAPGTHSNAVTSVPPPLAITAPPRPPPSQHEPHNTTAARPVIPLTRGQSQLQRSISVSHVAPPIQLASAPLDNFSDSDSDTVVSDTHINNNMVVDMLGPLSGPSSYSYPGRGVPSFRTRRDSTDRTSPNSYRHDAPSSSARDFPATRAVAPPAPNPRSQRREDIARADDQAYPRAPPGLAGDAVAMGADGSPTRGASDSPVSRPAGNAPALARTKSTRAAPANTVTGAPEVRDVLAAASSATVPVVPPRRDTRTPSPQNTGPAAAHAAPALAGGHSPTQASPTSGTPGPGALVVSAKRNVRWNDVLVCPSPVPQEQRRKGWFNRRGDQLWTNDGQYKVPAQGQEFPPDLALYPEPNTGWMNEEGVRIDMQHRLVPKPPLRPALKRRTL